MRLAKFLTQFPISWLLYCLASSPDNNGETSNRCSAQESFPSRFSGVSTVLHLLRRQSKFADDEFCKSRITLNPKTRRFPGMNDVQHSIAETDLWLMLNRSLIFNSKRRLNTSCRTFIASWSPTALMSSPCSKVLRSSKQNSAGLAVPFGDIAISRTCV